MIYFNSAQTSISSLAKQGYTSARSFASSAQTKSTATAKATFAAVSEKARAGASFVNNHKLAVSATVLTTIVAAGGAYYFQEDIAKLCGLGQEPKAAPAPKVPTPAPKAAPAPKAPPPVLKSEVLVQENSKSMTAIARDTAICTGAFVALSTGGGNLAPLYGVPGIGQLMLVKDAAIAVTCLQSSL